MSVRPRPNEKQAELWIATTDPARTPGPVFCDRLNVVLAEAKFDRTVESLCRPCYAEGKGRPSIPPSVSIPMLKGSKEDGTTPTIRTRRPRR
jgi:hypothetical protein